MSDMTTATAVLALARAALDGRKTERELLKTVDEILEDQDLDDETAEHESERVQALAEVAGEAWRDIADELVERDAQRRKAKANSGLGLIFPGDPMLN